jgi:acid phosphatase class B
MQAEVKANPVYSMNTDVKEKAVIFDIDNTLLNPEQRFRDAIRAGLIDKKGKAIVKGLMSKGKAYQKRNDFLYSDKSMKKDTVIYGAKELVKELSNKGYVIIYLTNRPATVNQKTIKQLESKGFPLSMSPTGDILVKSRGGGNYTAAKYKKNVMIDLLGRYDIEMIFDDEETVLEAAREVGIPGIYPSVASYSNPVKKNPENKTPNTTTDPNLDLDYDAEPDPVTGEQPTVMDTAGQRIFAKKGEKEEEESTQTTLFEFNPGSLPNPSPKPKRQKSKKTGKVRKERAKKYRDRLMESDKMRAEFPDRSQRYAVTLDLIEKHYGKAARNRIAPPIKANPADEKKLKKAKKLYEHMNGQPVDKIEKIKVDVGDVWYKVGEGGCWSIGYVSGKDGNAKNQRFNHIFNEETNDGNLPALYATMPDKGKPMLIIMGGTWKIKTDDSGVAWIYD